MNSVKCFKVSNNMPNRKAIERWLVDNNLTDNITYDWPQNILTFENDEDAVAFSLAFGISRYKTKIEQMIENEKDNNRR